jgi:ligand-binding sensor domain-containing protein
MKKLLTLLILFCCWSCIEEGDIPADVINEWTPVTTSDGLPSNLITTLYTDSKGNVWIGTTSGLSKFDGVSYTNYSVANGPLVNNWILSILEDRDDNIFVGTQDGLSFFDGDAWFYFPAFDNVEVTALAEASNGDVWAGTNGYGVVQLYYDGSGFMQHFDNACGSCNFIESIYNDNGTLLIGSQADLKTYDGSFESFTESDGLASSWVSAIGADHWGNIWLGSFAETNITRQRNSNFEILPLVSGTAFTWVRAIAEDRNGMLWMATDEAGLVYFDGAVMRQVLHVFDGEYVTALTIDKNGQLWVGTEGAGIQKYFPGVN